MNYTKKTTYIINGFNNIKNFFLPILNEIYSSLNFLTNKGFNNSNITNEIMFIKAT